MKNFQLNAALNRLQTISNLNTSDLCEALEIKKNILQGCVKDFNDIPLSSTIKIANAFGLNLESLITNNFCSEAALSYFKGNRLALPIRYQGYLSSNIKTITNFFTFIKSIYGDEQASSIARKLQLSDELIFSEDGKISGYVLNDLYQEMKRLKCPDEKFKELGYSASIKYKSEIIQNSLSERESPKSMYQKIVSNLSITVEKNLHYEIKVIGNSNLLLSVGTRKETSEMLKIRHFGCFAHCCNIMGWFSGFLTYISQEAAFVRKLSCVHQGDDHCLYEVDYSHFSQSKFSPPSHLHIVQ